MTAIKNFLETNNLNNSKAITKYVQTTLNQFYAEFNSSCKNALKDILASLLRMLFLNFIFETAFSSAIYKLMTSSA